MNLIPEGLKTGMVKSIVFALFQLSCRTTNRYIIYLENITAREITRLKHLMDSQIQSQQASYLEIPCHAKKNIHIMGSLIPRNARVEDIEAHIS